ncbi:MAG TPA: insulinase family protein, partial [Gemmatimonadaceae bacterium]|nr:insulinase family protein [Gemmatimonadaceae bacterium]
MTRSNPMRRSVALTVATAILAAAPQFLGAQVKPPPAGPLRPYAFPQINDFRLDNGLRVIVVEKHTLPIVTGRLMLDAGAMREPASKNGLAGITGTLLAEGTGNLSGADIAKEMDRIGAQFATGAGYSTSFANVTALTNVFPQALALAARTVIAPTFPEGEFTRVRNQALAAYQQSHARTAGLAADAFNRAAFDSTAPFSRPPNGVPATLKALTRA